MDEEEEEGEEQEAIPAAAAADFALDKLLAVLDKEVYPEQTVVPLARFALPGKAPPPLVYESAPEVTTEETRRRLLHVRTELQFFLKSTVDVAMRHIQDRKRQLQAEEEWTIRMRDGLEKMCKNLTQQARACTREAAAAKRVRMTATTTTTTTTTTLQTEPVGVTAAEALAVAAATAVPMAVAVPEPVPPKSETPLCSSENRQHATEAELVLYQANDGKFYMPKLYDWPAVFRNPIMESARRIGEMSVELSNKHVSVAKVAMPSFQYGFPINTMREFANVLDNTFHVLLGAALAEEERLKQILESL